MKLELKLAVAQIALLSLIAVLLLLLVTVGPPAKLTPLETSNQVTATLERFHNYRDHLISRISKLNALRENLPDEASKSLNLQQVNAIELEVAAFEKSIEDLKTTGKTAYHGMFGRVPPSPSE